VSGLAGGVTRLALIGAVVIASMLLVGRSTAPARCTALPIPLAALNKAINQPVVPFAENEIVAGEVVRDQAMIARVRDLLNQLDACANAGEPLRVWSLYSPAYLARLFQIPGPFDSVMYAAYATPQPGGTGRGVRIESIDAIWKVQDERYAVEAVKRYPSIPMPKRLVFWIDATGDRLLIEEITGEISFAVP
jgi:hypothetical protein